jgi:putative Mn2+ efflux pump MntP
MKQLYFIKWCVKGAWENIKNWDVWMWGWFVTCAWGPTAIMNRAESPAAFDGFMFFVLLFWIGYGVIYTGIKNAYKKFQNEQAQIVNHLKDVG